MLVERPLKPTGSAVVGRERDRSPSRGWTDTSTFRPARLRQGVLLALVGHVAGVIGALLAGSFSQPSPGGGTEDLAAAGLTLVGVEVLVGLVSGALLFRQGERERGLGLVAGWLGGLALVVIIIRRHH